TTLIEASAGTGKTFTLTALAVRYVAERPDLPVSKLLLVTFTRAATAELRGRLRQRLVEARDHLAGPPPPEAVGDALLDVLDECDADERARRHERLCRAVADFDTANVSTIHGFCSRVRAAMGVMSGENLDAVPAESEGAVISEV